MAAGNFKSKPIIFLFKSLILIILCMICIHTYRMPVHAQIAGGTYDGVDWQITDEGELIIGKTGETQEFTYRSSRSGTSYPWYNYRSQIKSASFAGAVKGNGSMSGMFYYCNKLTSLNLNEFDTSNVTTMDSMFYNCQALTSLDLSGFDTSNVTSMSSMFSGCKALTSIDVSRFNTSNVTSMSAMFSGCQALTSLDLSGFDTLKVTTMDNMFNSCKALTSLDVSGFDTSNVTNMQQMFYYCKALTSIDVSGFDTSKVMNMSYMFYGCKALTSLNVSGFNTLNVTNMYGMFSYCEALTSIDLSSFNTSNVTSMSDMFSYSGFKNLNLSTFDVSKCQSFSNMFAGLDSAENIVLRGWDVKACTSINVGDMGLKNHPNTNLDLSGWKNTTISDYADMFANVKVKSIDLTDFGISGTNTLRSMFANCYAKNLLISGWDTSLIQDMSSMFSYCTELEELDLTSLDVSNVTQMNSMFQSCKKLKIINTTGWDTSSVRSFYYMFYGCEGIEHLDLSKWNTINVNSMMSMFQNCYSLKTINLDGWDTSNVTTMFAMFKYDHKLQEVDLSSFDTSGDRYYGGLDIGSIFYDCNELVSVKQNFDTSLINNLYGVFYNCYKLRDVDVSNWRTSNVTRMEYLFYNCNSLTELDMSKWDFTKASTTRMLTEMPNLIRIGMSESFPNEFASCLPDKEWIREDHVYGPYSREELKNDWVPERAGVYVLYNESIVVFDGNGGISTAKSILVSDPNTLIQMPDETQTKRAHYSLAGWNTKADGSGDFYESGETYPDLIELGTNKTFFAQWQSSNTRNYTVYHYQQNQNRDGYNLRDKEILCGDTGNTVTPATKNYTGFIVPALQSTAIANDDSTIVNYYYDRIVYTVVFDGNGAESGSMPNQEYVGGISKGLNENLYGKKGSMFKGWNTEPDGTGTSYTNRQDLTLTVPNGSTITLYAQWLDNSDNQLEAQNGVIYVTAKAGQTIVIPDLPAGTKYTLEEVDRPDGWEYVTGYYTEGEISANKIIDAKVKNKYIATGQATIVAHKAFDGATIEQGQFAFELIENGAVIDSVTNSEIDNEPYVYTESGTMQENPWYQTAPVEFNAIQYTADDIGSHIYIIREKSGNDATIGYDSHEESVTVIVSDNGDGTLTANVEYDSDGALFKNELIPGKLMLSKTAINGNENEIFDFTVDFNNKDNIPVQGPFSARLYRSDEEIDAVRVITHTIYSHTPNITDDGVQAEDMQPTKDPSYCQKGEIITVPGVSSLHIKIWYTPVKGQLNVWPGEYTDIENDLKGQYINGKPGFYSSDGFRGSSNYNNDYRELYYAEFDMPGDTITIGSSYYITTGYDKTNEYNRYINYGYYAVVTGEIIEPYETGTPMQVSDGQTVSLRSGERLVVSDLPAGTNYQITELQKTGWDLVSSEGASGAIEPGITAAASFVNAYNAEGTAIITATKHLTGETLSEETFNFELLDENMDVLQLKTNNNLGNVIFDAINYETGDTGKTFHYFIRERQGDESYVYDDTVYPVDVTLTDPGTGTLSADIVYPDGNPVFENYKTHDISISKQVTGSMGDRNDSFEFTLALTGENLTKHDIAVLKNGKPVSMTPTGGIYTFSLKHDDMITFKGITSGVSYVITETSANKKNYTTSVDVATTGTVQDSDINVTFTNKREVAVNTGADAGRNLIFIAIMAAGSLAGFTMFRKKKSA